MGWTDFCDQYRIPYQFASADNIEVDCPFCIGHTGHKLGLSTVNPYWGCWRSEEDRGKNPVRAIQALIDCEWEEAKALAREYFKWTFRHEAVAPLVDEDDPPMKKPPDFMEFGFDDDLERPFNNYLKRRGFDAPQVISKYKLHWCISNRYANRLIIPVILHDNWFTFTARDITGRSETRYMAGHTKDSPNRPKETPHRLTDFLFNQEGLSGGDTLVIAEGPFDAMKINSAFIPGVQACALFGQQVSSAQLLALSNLKDGYNRVLIALDQDATLHNYQLRNKLSLYLPNLGVLDCPAKDWDACTRQQIKDALK